MKCKVKKIPKYSTGIPYAQDLLDQTLGEGIGTSSYGKSMQVSPFTYEGGKDWQNMTKGQKTMGVVNAAGTALNIASNSVGKPVTFGGVVNGIGQGAAAGASIGGPWGAVIGGAAGGLLASIGTGGSVDQNTGEITNPSGIAGLFGRSKKSLRNESIRITDTLSNRKLTQNLLQQYYSDPNNDINKNVFVNAAEGGIMRKPVDALVSKGELIYNPETKKLTKVPGSKGKPNKKDDVYARLSEGDVVISNSPTMVMANGKTPAQNLEGLINSDKNIKAKEAIIKKVVNWQEANKTEKQTTPKYAKGTKYVDSAYQLASMATPLFDVAKPEEVKYSVPQTQYLPTSVDYSTQLLDADQSYALSKYNLANNYANTGAGIAASVQAATNRAKQRAAVHQYVNNAQTELIGKNVGIYNNWQNNYSTLMNSVYDKSAANKAAARNINRQNRAAALKTWGQINKDKKQMEMDKLKLLMSEPMFKYGTENWESIVKQLSQMGIDLNS